jgi:hypothetical protein
MSRADHAQFFCPLFDTRDAASGTRRHESQWQPVWEDGGPSEVKEMSEKLLILAASASGDRPKGGNEGGERSDPRIPCS